MYKTLSGGAALAGQWLRGCLPRKGMRVRSPAGELNSHMPHGVTKLAAATILPTLHKTSAGTAMKTRAAKTTYTATILFHTYAIYFTIH